MAVFAAANVTRRECFEAMVKRELINDGPLDDDMTAREGDLAHYWDLASDAGMRSRARCGPKDPLPDGCLKVVD